MIIFVDGAKSNISHADPKRKGGSAVQPVSRHITEPSKSGLLQRSLQVRIHQAHVGPGGNAMNPKIFPTIIICFQLVAAIVYFCNGDIRRGIYWIAASVLIAAITF